MNGLEITGQTDKKSSWALSFFLRMIGAGAFIWLITPLVLGLFQR